MEGRRAYSLALAAALSATALVGCNSRHDAPADKAGGSNGPLVLRLGYVSWTDNGADGRLLAHFAAQVSKVSGGRLRIHVTDTDLPAPDEELQLARGVRGGRFDLGWISTRAWDDLGVRNFDALQAPFLITDQDTMNVVARSRLAKRMLHGVERYGVVGLGLFPRELLHPKGPRPLLRPSDYVGLQFLVARSRITDDLLAAFGAKAVYTLKSVTAGPPGAILPLVDEGGSIETGNVVLYARFGTLFANRTALDRLSGDQRAALGQAARDTLKQTIAQTTSERAAARAHCKTGPIAIASPADLVALQHAARPVTAKLERDPETRALVIAIRKLNTSTHRPSLAVPPACGRQKNPRTLREKPIPASILNGTYRYVLTKADAAKFGPPATNLGNTHPMIVTWTLRDGKWSSVGPDNDHGTYTVSGNRIAFVWPRVHYTNRFTFTRDRDGTVHLRPVLPMDLGDQFVWAAEPWRRIGPSIK